MNMKICEYEYENVFGAGSLNQCKKYWKDMKIPLGYR